MTKEQLFYALSDMDPAFIAEAAPVAAPPTTRRLRFLPTVAAALCVVSLTFAALYPYFSDLSGNAESAKYGQGTDETAKENQNRNPPTDVFSEPLRARLSGATFGAPTKYGYPDAGTVTETQYPITDYDAYREAVNALLSDDLPSGAITPGSVTPYFAFSFTKNGESGTVILTDDGRLCVETPDSVTVYPIGEDKINAFAARFTTE